MRAVLDRVKVRWRMKGVANTAGLAAFFIAYFWILNHPQFEVTQMPVTAVDYWIPHVPAAIVPYATLWVYLSLPLALMTRSAEFRSFGVAAFTLSVAGLACFYLWPTAVPVVAGWSPNAADSLLRNVDGGRNACPSLHVAFAVFSWVWLRRLVADMGGPAWVRFGNAFWCLAITLSTLATRQHVVLDVVAGAALGAAVAALNMQWLRRSSHGSFMRYRSPGTS
ncbi:phosphatase PAP2 family protein [Ramlibacter sp. PS3R-8]|uniref:phosphatase PAP2 family protein n=1 Tax=Ramlibacter sp. PS3R-8 TaxID=3133437 RepID=UPI0030A10A49